MSNSLETSEVTENISIMSRKKFRWALPIGATLLSAVGGLLFGYDTGVISGAMIQIRQQFALSYFYQEAIISITLAFAAIAALCSAGLTDWLGRKPVILIASAVFTIGAVVLGVAQNKETLLAGRLIVGLGIGMASMTVPVYIAEIAPTQFRGIAVTLNTVCITGGQFLAGIVDGIFIADSVNGWRYMLALGGIPSAIQLLGFLAMPESPRWLVEKRRIAEAREVLRRTHGGQLTPAVENELQRIMDASRSFARMDTVDNSITARHENPHVYQPLKNETVTSSMDSNSTSSSSSIEDENVPRQGFKDWCAGLTIMRVLRYPPTRRCFFISCALQAFQQLVGINTVMYYSASIISMAGIGSNFDAEYRDSTVVWMSAVVAFANFAFCSLSLWLISRVRRRILLLCSLSGVLFSLVLLGVSFQLIASYSSPVTFVEEPPISKSHNTSNSDCLLSRTCDECMRTALCGFCYYMSPMDSTVMNASCVPSAGEYSPYSAYGRCSNSSMDNLGLVWAYDHCPTRFGWLTLFGLLLYLAAFAPGMAPLPWTIIAEMFPTWARSTGMAAGATCNWIANIFVSLTFLTLTEAITRQGTYFLYAGIAILGLIFVYRCVPETSDTTLEDIAVPVADSSCIVSS